MIVNVSVSAETTRESSQVIRFSGENLDKFPAVFIGRDSYIVSMQNENGLNFNQDYVYNVHIGNYCAVAHEVSIVIDINHEYTSVSTGNLTLPPHIAVPKHLKRKGQIIIQNDVWIGRGATLMGGITIHNGAVVAANAVVTKDVPPYSIVGGNPARVIKYRFEQEVIEKFLAIQWWNWSKQKINDKAVWFTRKPDEFVDHFYAENVVSDKKILDFEKVPKQFVCFEDDSEGIYASWPRILREFCVNFRQREDCGLVIFVSQEKRKIGIYEKIMEIAEPMEADCSIFIYMGGQEEEKAIFQFADYYITSRNAKTVYHTCLANQHHIPVLSGVDIPLFVRNKDI